MTACRSSTPARCTSARLNRLSTAEIECGNQRQSSVAIRGNQRQSEAIRGN